MGDSASSFDTLLSRKTCLCRCMYTHHESHSISPGYKDNKYVTTIQLLLTIQLVPTIQLLPTVQLPPSSSCPSSARHPAPAHYLTRARHPAHV